MIFLRFIELTVADIIAPKTKNTQNVIFRIFAPRWALPCAQVHSVCSVFVPKFTSFYSVFVPSNQILKLHQLQHLHQQPPSGSICEHACPKKVCACANLEKFRDVFG